jgi:hypothetical protein
MVDFKKIADKIEQAIQCQAIQEEMYSTEMLRRSLPYATKIDIESDDDRFHVVVHYKNGLTAKIQCFEKPSKTEQLINLALAAAHQCLSEIGSRARFNFNGKMRHVWRSGRSKPPIISCELVCDAPKFEGAVPDGAPCLREVQLSVQGIACLPGENKTSTGAQRIPKTKSMSYDDNGVAQFERSKPKYEREKKILLDRKVANRAANAMAELLRSVGLDEPEKK